MVMPRIDVDLSELERPNMTDSPLSCNHGHRWFHRTCILLLTCVIMGCGAVQPVRVLPDGQTSLTASVGGAVGISASPAGFVPYTVAGVAHGLTDQVTVHGNLHAIMAAFGVIGLDAGASLRVSKQDGVIPEVTAAARAIMFMKPSAVLADMRVYPDVSLTLSWDLGQDWLGYAGSHATVQLSDGRTFMSPMLGIVAPVSDAWSLQLETIWQAANVDTRKGIFEGQSSIGGTGSLGLFLGAQVRL